MYKLDELFTSMVMVTEFDNQEKIHVSQQNR